MTFMRYFIPTLLFLTIIVNVHATDSITVASGESGVGWSQYAKHYGYMIHLTTEAFASMGIKVNIRFLPWKRAYVTAKYMTDAIEASCCWFYVEERTKVFYYSDPVVEDTMVFFHLKSYKFDWNTIDDLGDIMIGGNIGFHYGKDFQKAEKEGKIKVDRTRDDNTNLKKLLVGRIDIFPIAVITAYGELHKIYRQDKKDRLTYHPKPVLKKKLHLLISKKMEKERVAFLLSSFNRGIDKIKETGKYDEIVKNAESGYYELMDGKWSK